MVRLQHSFFTSKAWHQLCKQARLWRIGALPGLAVLSCVLLARGMGTLQNLEWAFYDQGLRSRPVEAPDQRVVVIGINESDIRRIGAFPVPDRTLAQLLATLQTYKPRVIGLDIFRDLTSSPDRAELSKVLTNSPNLIGIEVTLSENPNQQIKPPPELPRDRIGVTDAILDPDGRLRRQLLATKVESGETRYSLATLLTKSYLQAEGIRFQAGDRASAPLTFIPPTGPSLILPRFTKNSGGYMNAAAGGNQLLLSFRNHPQPFTILSFTDVVTGKVKPEQIRDRVVLVGMTNASSNDTFMTSALPNQNSAHALRVDTSNQYQLIYGVEINAHAVSAMISAVLDRRPSVQTWDDAWEYLWIVGWGILGIGLGLFFQSPWKTLIGLGFSCGSLWVIGYGLLAQSLWIPLVPALLACLGAGLTTALFDQRAKDLLEQRSLTLKHTYDAVHNGPLQTLAAILRSELPSDRVRSQLQNLNRELRSVYDSMHQSLVTLDEADTLTPLPDLLYQVYESTLRRDLPGFATIKTYIPPDFSCLANCTLSPLHKQRLCIFLEEALCNVGKHAIEASYLDVICDQQTTHYRLCVIDNGRGPSSNLLISQTGQSNSGWGTTQAQDLARQLNGKFHRRPHPPQGVACELIWSNQTALWHPWRQRWQQLMRHGPNP